MAYNLTADKGQVQVLITANLKKITCVPFYLFIYFKAASDSII